MLGAAFALLKDTGQAAQTPFRTFVLGLGDVAGMDALLTMFGEAFDEADTYGGARPGGPAIALYSKLGTREAVLHFDIAVRQRAKKYARPLPAARISAP